MKLEEITHPKLKNYINLVYMQGENNNQKAILELEENIREYIKDNYYFETLTEKHDVRVLDLQLLNHPEAYNFYVEHNDFVNLK